MNFYKHHLGDYDGATAHLSWDEDQAYTRLLRVYYRLERPIPVDTGEACRLTRARTTQQRQAIETVLREFFELRDDGWHNRRADEEVAAYRRQADTNRRIARGRFVDEPINDSLNEPSTKGQPNHKPVTKNQEPRKSTARKRATPLPADFKVSDRVEAWAKAKGFSQLDRYLEFFLSKAKAKGYTYVDWDEAFMGCVREDWAGIRSAATNPPAARPNVCAYCPAPATGTVGTVKHCRAHINNAMDGETPLKAVA